MAQSNLGRWFYLAAVVVLLTSMALSCSNRRAGMNSLNRGAAYNNRGLAYRNKGEYDQAIVEYTEAIRLDPRMSMFYSFRAKVYRALDDDAMAAEDEGKVRELRQ
jgi:Tfp pilus assembly protein PilF